MESNSGRIIANRVDIPARTIQAVELSWEEGVITSLSVQGGEDASLPYLLPGFVDAHVHVESSMLTPAEFARQAVRHGTLATVSDPHEIANVLGVEGVHFMLENAAQTPFHFLFGAPSCVPATPFETAGAELGLEDVEQLLQHPMVGYLSEMMNFPGVLADDPQVMAKIQAARRLGLPVDGHAPGLVGEQAQRYAAAGISTDHECFSLEEAKEKIAAGMHILIREGSAARNFAALHPLISLHPQQVMLCSDDKHPDDLVDGHINRLVARAVAEGHDLFDVLGCACINPLRHYALRLGQLNLGESMDGILVNDLKGFAAKACWLKGEIVAEDGRSLLPHLKVTPINRFKAKPIDGNALRIVASGEQVRVIEALDGELVTHELFEPPLVVDGIAEPDTGRDMLLLAVVNRYQPAQPALAFIRNFGLREGAIASSVAHDSHNIVAVGADRQSLAAAINAVIETHGGISVVDSQGMERLPLPVAGIMSDREGEWVAERYAALDQRAKALGCSLRAPFMTLSFMALLVIPELKLSDRGLFDGRSFDFVSIWK